MAPLRLCMPSRIIPRVNQPITALRSVNTSRFLTTSSKLQAGANVEPTKPGTPPAKDGADKPTMEPQGAPAKDESKFGGAYNTSELGGEKGGSDKGKETVDPEAERNRGPKDVGSAG